MFPISNINTIIEFFIWNLNYTYHLYIFTKTITTSNDLSIIPMINIVFFINLNITFFISILVITKNHTSFNDFKVIKSSPYHLGLILEKEYKS